MECDRLGVRYQAEPSWFHARQLAEYEEADIILVPSTYSRQTFPAALQSKTLVAPLIAFVTQAYVVYLCLSNMDFLGGGYKFANYIVWIDIAVVGIGIIGAFIIRASNPKKFDEIGRLIYEGLPDGSK